MIRIAIVDDHKILTEGLKGIIEDSGIAQVVGIAHNAVECRHAIGFWNAELLLLDVGLPDISGIDFCKEIRERYPLLKVVALTTHNAYSIVKQMLDNGASGYIIKNAMAEEVLAGIQAVAEGNIFLCHEINVLMNRPKEKHIWLSQRERKMLELIVEGFTNIEIAERIFLSPETIRGYRKNLLLKLGAKNTAVLVKMAVEQKLI